MFVSSNMTRSAQQNRTFRQSFPTWTRRTFAIIAMTKLLVSSRHMFRRQGKVCFLRIFSSIPMDGCGFLSRFSFKINLTGCKCGGSFRLSKASRREKWTELKTLRQTTTPFPTARSISQWLRTSRGRGCCSFSMKLKAENSSQKSGPYVKRKAAQNTEK